MNQSKQLKIKVYNMSSLLELSKTYGMTSLPFMFASHLLTLLAARLLFPSLSSDSYRMSL